MVENGTAVENDLEVTVEGCHAALAKLAVREPESAALRRYLRRRRPLVSSALARTEVARALGPLGPAAVGRGQAVLGRVDLSRINDRILRAAGSLEPPELRSLDAIHLSTALRLGEELAAIVTADAAWCSRQKASAAASLGPPESPVPATARRHLMRTRQQTRRHRRPAQPPPRQFPATIHQKALLLHERVERLHGRAIERG